MKIIMEPTSKIVKVNGVDTRVWQGRTESGIPCHAHIALVGVDRDNDADEFARELKEVASPRADLSVLPLRMLVD